MSSRSIAGLVLVALGSWTMAPLPAGAQIPETVAPGATQRVAVIEGRCPTFIWAAVPGALEHEVVAYRVPHQPTDAWPVDLGGAPMVAYARVPGGATAWTPELSDCLEPDGSYVWFVRGILNRDRGAVTDWSSGRFFAIPAFPTPGEVEEAIRVLRRYAASAESVGRDQDGRRGVEHSVSRTRRDDDGPRTSAPIGHKSVTSAGAAIEATPSGTSGEMYGVVGVTGSPGAAGLGAANTGGGPDLVLDGVSDGEADARFSQSGVDRPSLSPQVYDIENSLGGGMTLRVDGDDVVTTLTDQDTPPRDAGNQLDLVGNTLDVLEGPGSGLDGDTLDGLHAAAFANVVHDHHGQTWSGTGSWGLRAESSDGHGLYGRTTASNGLVYGVFGQSASDGGRGVYAEATAPSGTTYGVYGRAESTGGIGVFGWADALTGPTFGVIGKSSSVAGHGVWGEATSTTGYNEGVRGQSASSEGRGVYGLASAPTGTTFGVLGTSNSTAGRECTEPLTRSPVPAFSVPLTRLQVSPTAFLAGRHRRTGTAAFSSTRAAASCWRRTTRRPRQISSSRSPTRATCTLTGGSTAATRSHAWRTVTPRSCSRASRTRPRPTSRRCCRRSRMHPPRRGMCW